MVEKNILLVCFSFPPFPGIGGRRWAKFAKYLAKENVKVNVLAAKNSSSAISEWLPDTKSPNIILHELPLGLSGVFSFYPANFYQKIVYRTLSGLASFMIKGNPQDKVFFIKDRFLQEAEQIIKKNNIDTLIVTIPPYKLAYYFADLKEKFPHIKFIVDYRDPWTDNRSYHGFAELSKERLEKETEYEKKVLEKADIICDVNEFSLKSLEKKTKSKARFVHLPNGFDEEDYSSPVNEHGGGPVKRFIYTGSFYPNLIYLLEPIIQLLLKLKASRPDIYNSLRFDFYGNMDHKAQEVLKRSNCTVITFHGNIPRSQVIDEIKDSDYCLMFAADDHSHAFNTKFYEYLYLKKPVLYFGNRGPVAEYIEHNNAGLVFTPSTLNKGFGEFINELKDKPLQFNKELDISEFDVKALTRKLLRIINE